MRFLKEYNEAKKVFIKPVRKYYLGKLAHGTPYFWPMNFDRNILTIRKLKLKSIEEIDKLSKYVRDRKINYYHNVPMVRRQPNWIIRLFGNDYYVAIGWPISIGTVSLGWKDKFETPRYEWAPIFYIYFFRWQFCIWWYYKQERVWEQMLWYLCYADKDIKKAKETWPWRNMAGQSTWNDDCLLKDKKLKTK